jgi:hypothetical protein
MAIVQLEVSGQLKTKITSLGIKIVILWHSALTNYATTCPFSPYGNHFNLIFPCHLFTLMFYLNLYGITQVLESTMHLQLCLFRNLTFSHPLRRQLEM